VSHHWDVGTNGLHLISLPVTPLEADAPEVFGIPASDFLLARWEPSLPPEGAYRIWPSIDPLAMGRGYWLRILSAVDATVSGLKAAGDEDFSIDLKLGWNMIGSPRTDPVPVANLMVAVGTNTPVTLAQAVTAHVVQSGIFGYSQSTGYELAESLTPFAGYWIRCINAAGCRLVFPGTAAATASVRAKSSNVAWRLPLVARAGAQGATAYLGCAADATDKADAQYDAMAPPQMGAGVTCLLAADGAKAAYATDFRPATRGDGGWELEVGCQEAGTPVVLSWPDMSSLPQDVRPVLIDEAAGRRQYMRTTTEYTIAATASGTSRRLRIEVPKPSAGGLAITALAQQPTAAGVELAYTLSAEAAVNATVVNIAGRPVRSLARDRAQAAGANALLWNLRDDGGSLAPNGTYLLRLEAYGPDGQRVSRLQSLQVLRR
jgi:hypothetical protein